MKRLFLLLALLTPAGAFAQTATEWGARASVEANYKISKGVHVYAEEELRTEATSLSSMRTTLGFTYKPFKALKLGVGYTLINTRDISTATFKEPRHRVFADITGSLQLGYFQFSLKERLQYTRRTGTFNVYQNNPDALALKSKFTIKYKGFYVAEPYASFELRTALNEPWGTTSGEAQWNKGGTKTYYNYTPSGYTHVYNNRYRGEVGVSFNFSKRHELKPYLLIDYNDKYELDTNAEGTKLFSAQYANSIMLSPGLSYIFSF